MKAKLFSIFLALILISTLFLPKTFAEYENYMQLRLPEDAKARLGKGWINDTAGPAIAYTPDGTRLAVAGSIGIWIYDVETGKALDLLVGHTDVVNSVAFSPDGKHIVSGSGDNTLRLWNANTGDPIRTFTGHADAVNSVAFSPDRKHIVSGSEDRTVRLWDTNTGDLLHTLTEHKGWIYSVAFAPDGKHYCERRLEFGSPFMGYHHGQPHPNTHGT